MEHTLYHYKAHIIRVYDGDTCTADVDLGMHTWIRGETLRLLRIDAPEIRGEERPEGLKSRDYLRLLIDQKEVLIQTFKDRRGKYGRYLAEIWLHENGQWINVNDRMVATGFAKTYKD